MRIIYVQYMNKLIPKLTEQLHTKTIWWLFLLLHVTVTDYERYFKYYERSNSYLTATESGVQKAGDWGQPYDNEMSSDQLFQLYRHIFIRLKRKTPEVFKHMMMMSVTLRQQPTVGLLKRQQPTFFANSFIVIWNEK